jgi:hypothetical protein
MFRFTDYFRALVSISYNLAKSPESFRGKHYLLASDLKYLLLDDLELHRGFNFKFNIVNLSIRTLEIFQ